MTTAIFRVDSSIDIGTGHVMRCLALADEFKNHEIKTHFICRDLPGNIHKLILTRGHSVTVLPLLALYKSIAQENDYAGWLQVTQEQDAQECISHLKQLNLPSRPIIIADHYALDKSWEVLIKNHSQLLIIIDDLVREHEADIIIDQTLGRSEKEYEKSSQCKTILVGSEYAMIRSQFYLKREESICSHNERPMNIFISMGGSDKDNILALILDELKNNKILWIKKIAILINSTSSNYKQIEKITHQCNYDIELINFVDDMANFMSNYSLAIGAPGTTTWERATMGIPAVLIPIAENQQDITRVYKKYNAGEILFPNEIKNNLISALNKIKDNYEDLRNINYQITDGLGIRRIIYNIWPLKAKDGVNVTICKAMYDDIMQVYEWQCQPQTRRYARNSKIPSLTEHIEWMTKRLHDPKCYFYIIKYGHEKVGVVRLDWVCPLCYEISIFIDEKKKKLNIAKNALILVSELHLEVDLIAIVLKENLASQMLFSSLNYTRLNETKFKLERRVYG
ncbi:UDP-2,4-diacetamido-2,4,6-trideoxy-beta-L-altropyranose hydrolase [Tolumonas lignilytica]|uniref:UDP-2,4-diacetamido-2,4, 6-trideoxy-beta-L-altropyranose hydrolase n=1 Tax=Tolumonas lignilytica TaxID=1283284 RepID=UPI000465F3FE|nr:UDP-2,4-diacetamido-2,4,6-trideoxy-beta-L-altropyranose hydrolase [Tolumonas lignilytica]